MARKRENPETPIVKEILDYLLFQGVFCWRVNNQAVIRGGGFDGKKRFCKNPTPGIPDIMGICWNGRALAIEVKTETGRVSPDQKRFLKEFEKAGGFAFVARSLKDVETRIEEIKTCSNITV